MPRKFKETYTIKEHHLDTFGHVNNATYLQLYEQARWDMMHEMGMGPEEIERDQKGPVIVELNLKFKKELINRSEITITTQFQKMLNPLVMEIYQEILNQKGELASSLTLSIGVMDLSKRKLCRPSEKWLRCLGLESSEIERLVNI